jgi:hypothetical protein
VGALSGPAGDEARGAAASSARVGSVGSLWCRRGSGALPALADLVGGLVTGPIAAALSLAAAVADLIPEPDPVIRRARMVARLTARVTRLSAILSRTVAEEARLSAARAALDVLRENVR